MTQEDKDLLLKDLCARLPHGVKVKVWYYSNKVIDEILTLESLAHITETDSLSAIKPYLRPMSSMTKEEKKDYDKLFTIHSDGDIYCENWEWSDFMNSHHFDYRGLIPKDLAIEAPEGMYDLK